MEMQQNTIHRIILILESNLQESEFDWLRKLLQKYEAEATKTAKGFDALES